MKILSTFLSILLIVSCATGKERTYTGSTPAAAVIRSFLGISLSDSIDFIRWELFLRDDNYHLHCNYGIARPNTNGFINGGIKMEISGEWKKQNNYYQLQNGDKTLKVAELNDALLHLLDKDNSLLVGNGGWSYTLNNIAGASTDEVNFAPAPTALKDSMAFEGRTPCNIPGLIPSGVQCYKLKWHIVLYANAERNDPATYKIFGTPWRKEGGRTGSWKIITGKNKRTIYQLNDDKGNGLLYLLKIDEHVLMFTDAGGKLLVGNEDFSYTINKKW